MEDWSLEKLDNEHKLLVYTVSQSDGGTKTKTHLQKMIFQGFKILEMDPQEELGYIPHYYGPYSLRLEEIRKDLVDRGVLMIKGDGFIIADLPEKEIEKIIPRNEYVAFVFRRAAKFIGSLTKKEVLLFNYVIHPDYTENSVVFDEIMRDRVDCSIRMVKNEKISVNMGARLAGKDVVEFEEMLLKRGVYY